MERLAEQASLSDAAAQDSLRLLGDDPPNWVRPTAGITHDVAIIGGGQSGVAIAYALRRAGIGDVTVLDAAAEGDVGVWLSPARMRVLRTSKRYIGPELGNPALSFRAWYEGLHGRAAYEAIDHAPRTDWATYIRWFQHQSGVAVRYGTQVEVIEPGSNGLQLHVVNDGGRTTEAARKIVLATGAEGTGGPYVPAIFDGLPRDLYSHTGHEIDFAALRGSSVAVLGAASSAFDAAAAALEVGAAEVHLFSRRPRLVVRESATQVHSSGATANFHLLSDAERWQRRWTAASQGPGVPLDSLFRATAFPNFHMHLSAPWSAVSAVSGEVVVEASDGAHNYEFVIVGTGYQQDPHSRLELAKVADDVALWEDVYQPPGDLRSDQLGRYPYLGAGYSFREKVLGTAPWVYDIHAYNLGASQSFGCPVGDIPSMSSGIPRLVEAIAHDLHTADQARPRPATQAAGSFFGSYAHSIWQPGAAPVTKVTARGRARR